MSMSAVTNNCTEIEAACDVPKQESMTHADSSFNQTVKEDQQNVESMEETDPGINGSIVSNGPVNGDDDDEDMMVEIDVEPGDGANDEPVQSNTVEKTPEGGTAELAVNTSADVDTVMSDTVMPPGNQIQGAADVSLAKSSVPEETAIDAISDLPSAESESTAVAAESLSVIEPSIGITGMLTDDTDNTENVAAVSSDHCSSADVTKGVVCTDSPKADSCTENLPCTTAENNIITPEDVTDAVLVVPVSNDVKDVELSDTVKLANDSSSTADADVSDKDNTVELETATDATPVVLTTSDVNTVDSAKDGASAVDTGRAVITGTELEATIAAGTEVSTSLMPTSNTVAVSTVHSIDNNSSSSSNVSSVVLVVSTRSSNVAAANNVVTIHASAPSTSQEKVTTPALAAPPEQYRPVGQLLMNIGKDLVSQVVFKEIVDQQDRWETSTGEEKEKIERIKKAHMRIVDKNSVYMAHAVHICSCGYQALTLNELSLHHEYGGPPSKTCVMRKCCLCSNFSSVRSQQFLLHMKVTHGRFGRLELMQALQCPFCPSESRRMAYLNDHVERCRVNFKPELNLAHRLHLFDIPLYVSDLKTTKPQPRKAKTDRHNNGDISVCRNSVPLPPPIPTMVASADVSISGSTVTITGLAVNKVAQAQQAGVRPVRFAPVAPAPGVPVVRGRGVAVRQRLANATRLPELRPAPSGHRASLASFRMPVNLSSVDAIIANSAAAAASDVMRAAAAAAAAAQYNNRRPQRPVLMQPGIIGSVQQVGRRGPFRSTPANHSYLLPLSFVASQQCAPVPTQLIRNQRLPSPVVPAMTVADAVRSTVCEVCGAVNPSPQMLREHLWKSHNTMVSYGRFFGPESERPVPCPSCTRRFFCVLGLERHERLFHSVPQTIQAFDCHRCKDTGITDILGHLKTNHSITLRDMVDFRVCYMCRQNFTALPDLQRHMLTVHRDLFPSLTALVQKINDGSKKVSLVPRSAVAVNAAGGLQLRTPLSPLAATPRACARVRTNRPRMAPNGFPRMPQFHRVLSPQNLPNNVVAVPDEKSAARRKRKFRCGSCSDAFCTQEELTAHCKLHHKILCSRCSERFDSLDLLHSHFTRHQSEKDRCVVCSEKVQIGRPMVRHMKRMHLSECSVVVMRLSQETLLQYRTATDDTPHTANNIEPENEVSVIPENSNPEIPPADEQKPASAASNDVEMMSMLGECGGGDASTVVSVDENGVAEKSVAGDSDVQFNGCVEMTQSDSYSELQDDMIAKAAAAAAAAVMNFEFPQASDSSIKDDSLRLDTTLETPAAVETMSKANKSSSVAKPSEVNHLPEVTRDCCIVVSRFNEVSTKHTTPAAGTQTSDIISRTDRDSGTTDVVKDCSIVVSRIANVDSL